MRFLIAFFQYLIIINLDHTMNNQRTKEQKPMSNEQITNNYLNLHSIMP